MAEPGYSGSGISPSLIIAAQLAAIGWSASMAANTSLGVLVALIVAVDLVAIAVLGPFDYVAHYGLARRQRPGGGYEPMSDLHSWNAEGRVTNLLLLNLGHHSDHHWKPSQPYWRLGPISDTPLLPGDCAGAILTALVPPLWHRCVDKLAEHWVRRTQDSAASEPAERSARSPI